METTKNRYLVLVLNISLWIAQILLAIMFFNAGQMKLFHPMEQLAVIMPWSVDVPVWLVRFIGTCELLGSIGLLLPSILRIKPMLTPIAAFGFALIMLFAAIFHVSRGEGQFIGFHIIVMIIAIFIIWGRIKISPIRSKTK